MAFSLQTLFMRTVMVITIMLCCISARISASEAQLNNILQEAQHSHSDSLLIIHNEQILKEYYTEAGHYPIELMSAFKSVVSLAVGNLITTGKITSLDQPVYEFYPEWKQGRKQQITIRHLLNHTSGLQNTPNAGEEIYPNPDATKLALAAELSDDPGTAFSYNNKATNLLAGIIHQASGLRMDQYLVQTFFIPMGIEHYKFYYDQSGNPHGMAGLQLMATDFAKFGQLILNKGQWQQQQLVSSQYIDEMLAAGQSFTEKCGLLWWRVPGNTQQPDAYYADGYLGQYMVVIPQKNLIAVRQIKQKPDYNQQTDGFKAFISMITELAATL